MASDQGYDKLINKFIFLMDMLNDWCSHNLLDINWSKTKVMFIKNQRKVKSSLPNKIIFNNNKIDVVKNFKLLGIIIDDKLLFTD
jgi:hypothetical protein